MKLAIVDVDFLNCGHKNDVVCIISEGIDMCEIQKADDSNCTEIVFLDWLKPYEILNKGDR